MTTSTLERKPTALPRIRLPRLTVRSADAQRRFEFRIGIAAILVTVAALVAAVGAFVIPFGETVYRAEFATSGDVRVGDDVRVAGISLGKVRSVTLVGDHAEIAFGLDSAVHVGIDSRVVVKLLTPIGGRYLSVEPAGPDTAAGRVIPRERTKTPYDLGAVLEATTPSLAALDAGKLRETIAKLAGAFEEQPDALNGILTGVNSLSAVVAQRRDEFARALDVAKEYLETLVNKLDRLQLAGNHVLDIYRIVAANRDGLATMVGQIRRFFDYLTPIFRFADEQLGPALEPLYDTIDKSVAELVSNKDALASMSTNLRQLLEWFARNSDNPYVTVDHSGAIVTDTPLCPQGKAGC
ncbi:MlaD family protein [Nocardia huaxiensis]|uniref:MCE family protein n=1 Tax=Nocardia huaxiensis TaxID=2755382 RepID=A0A7D6V990_9NOCA|nr:MlaD family protein [Nocardia huaxiensis]QLY29513.1 MCE family protein [Nocardia huaxiensis]UFS96929.1 MlaD family protein [Nocardia huaxiensis]